MDEYQHEPGVKGSEENIQNLKTTHDKDQEDQNKKVKSSQVVQSSGFYSANRYQGWAWWHPFLSICTSLNDDGKYNKMIQRTVEVGSDVSQVLLQTSLHNFFIFRNEIPSEGNRIYIFNMFMGSIEEGESQSSINLSIRNSIFYYFIPYGHLHSTEILAKRLMQTVFQTGWNWYWTELWYSWLSALSFGSMKRAESFFSPFPSALHALEVSEILFLIKNCTNSKHILQSVKAICLDADTPPQPPALPY